MSTELLLLVSNYTIPSIMNIIIIREFPNDHTSNILKDTIHRTLSLLSYLIAIICRLIVSLQNQLSNNVSVSLCSKRTRRRACTCDQGKKRLKSTAIIVTLIGFSNNYYQFRSILNLNVTLVLMR